MDIKTLLIQCHQILQDSNIDHALIGGLALGAHGVQRFTNDVDFLVNGNDRLRTKEAMFKRGYSVYFESEEVLQFEGPGQVDFLLANRTISQNLLQSAVFLDELPIKCVTIEGLIGLKIQAYKNAPKREFQDKADIQALIHCNPKIDWGEVKTYADLFGEWEAIVAIRARLKD